MGNETVTGVRAYHERLLLSAVRAQGALSKAALARETGLSAQAVSVIAEGLIEQGLLQRGARLRGRVGQPPAPLSLNPDGAFALGLKIGRRSVEAALIDFTGAVRARDDAPLKAPLPEPSLAAVAALGERALQSAPRDRVVGLGLAMPGDLHEWSEELGLAPGALEGWRGRAPAAELGAALGLEAEAVNDATAAAAAELALGEAMTAPESLYIYIGAFAGGGLALNGRLWRGRRGNAAALGSMPVSSADPSRRPHQLLSLASLTVLERLREELGDAYEGFAQWRDAAAPALAQSIAAAQAVLEIDEAVIDGQLEPRERTTLVAAVEDAHRQLNLAGLSPVAIREGSLGAPARVLGAALLPLQRRFAPDPDLLLRAPKSEG